MKYEITYLYLYRGGGRITIAILPHEDNTIEIGAAFCSPQDRFVKKIGRELALKRLKEKNFFYVSFEHDGNIKLKDHVAKLIDFIIKQQWVSVLDFDIELNTTIYNIITEAEHEIPCEVGPLTCCTNVIPQWAKTSCHIQGMVEVEPGLYMVKKPTSVFNK